MSQQCSTCGAVYFTVTHNCPDNMPDDFDSNISEESLRQWIPDNGAYEEPDESPCIHCGVHSDSIHRHTCPNVTHRELKRTVDDLLGKIARYKNRSKNTKISVIVSSRYSAEQLALKAVRMHLTVKMSRVKRGLNGHYSRVTISGQRHVVWYFKGYADAMNR